VYGGLRNWLLSLGLTFVVGTIASIVTIMQARTFPEENRDVARALTPLNGVRAVLSMLLLVLCLAAWALYDVLRLEQVQNVVALVALVAMIVFLGSSVPYWNRILAYARGEYKKAAN
jgi:DMSO reductase anchor subunit